jgi:hypothetical protein
MTPDDRDLATAARELRNYANVLVRSGSGTNRYISKILALATKLDGNQPDSRFSPRQRGFLVPASSGTTFEDCRVVYDRERNEEAVYDPK